MRVAPQLILLAITISCTLPANAQTHYWAPSAGPGTSISATAQAETNSPVTDTGASSSANDSFGVLSSDYAQADAFSDYDIAVVTSMPSYIECEFEAKGEAIAQREFISSVDAYIESEFSSSISFEVKDDTNAFDGYMLVEFDLNFLVNGYFDWCNVSYTHTVSGPGFSLTANTDNNGDIAVSGYGAVPDELTANSYGDISFTDFNMNLLSPADEQLKFAAYFPIAEGDQITVSSSLTIAGVNAEYLSELVSSTDMYQFWGKMRANLLTAY